MKKNSRYRQGIFVPKNIDKFIGERAIYRSGLELKFFRFCDNNPKVVRWGSENVVIGNEAGENMTTGNQHTLIGMYAGQAITSNSSSVCIGYKAGKNTAGSSELFIARSDTANNQSSTWIYGDSSGTCYQGNNSTTWTTSSDERIKKDIVDSSNGLAKIDAIQVRNFNYRTQEEITCQK